MAGLLTQRIPATVPCVHCGLFHSAESGIDFDTAVRLAKRECDRCGRMRQVRGLPDEGTPPDHPEVSQ